MKTGYGGMAPLTPNLVTWLNGYLYTPAALPHREGLLYPLIRSLNGPQGRPAHVGYLLPVAERFSSKHFTTAQGSVTCHTVICEVLGS